MIILQADHGSSDFNETTHGHLERLLFPEYITRVILAYHAGYWVFHLVHYLFGIKFSQLKDTSCYSEYPYAYHFDTVPNQCQPTPN